MRYKFNDRPVPFVNEPRQDKGRMKEEELEKVMRSLLKDAQSLVDDELSPAREKASKYYHGDKFGNEEEGRSQFVVTEVRDTVRGLLPTPLRLFFGAERAVEFIPRTKEKVALAEQATDYTQYVFVEDNNGLMVAYAALLDAFVRKIGVVKWGWEAGRKLAQRNESVAYSEVAELIAREDVDVTAVEPVDGADVDAAAKSYAAGEDDTSGAKFNVDYTVKLPGRVRVWAIPTEEWLVSSDARTVEDAMIVSHRMYKSRGELLALGIEGKVIDEHGGSDTQLDDNAEALERRETITSQSRQRELDAGKANEQHLYIESYPLVDYDGDGVQELRKVCTLGPKHHVVMNVPCDERPFAVFCALPEPHMVIGQSYADITMDLQLVKSSVARGMLDSLALAIFPRMVGVEGQVSLEDMLNTSIGNIIRAKRADAVQVLAQPFTGEKALTVLEYFDGVSESRTGRSKGATDLDADALQSSTQQGVQAVIDATKAQEDMLCRLFAEMFMKPLFRGIYKLLMKHRPAKRLVKLRGTYVEIDVAHWDSDMDATVNVALGSTAVQQKIDTLNTLKEEQKSVLATFGPTNPLVSLPQYGYTLRKLTELAGYKDTDNFVSDVPMDWQPPQPEGPPPPSPEEVIAQAQIEIERMKTERELAMKQAELDLKRDAQRFEQAFRMEELATKTTLERYKIDAQFAAQHSQRVLELEQEQERSAIEAAVMVREQHHAEQVAAHEAQLQREKQQHEMELAQQQQEHDQMIAQQQVQAPAEGA